MQTQIISWDSTDGYKPDELEQAAKILKNGGLVVFPTEKFMVWDVTDVVRRLRKKSTRPRIAPETIR